MWRLPELDLTTSGTNSWMLRVLDPTAAIEASGWSPAISGQIEIEVAAVGQPSAPIHIEFADGRAQVSPATTPRVRLAAGAFSAWYAGAMSVRTAAMLGLASGSPDDLALMDALTCRSAAVASRHVLSARRACSGASALAVADHRTQPQPRSALGGADDGGATRLDRDPGPG